MCSINPIAAREVCAKHVPIKLSQLLFDPESASFFALSAGHNQVFLLLASNLVLIPNAVTMAMECVLYMSYDNLSD